MTDSREPEPLELDQLLLWAQEIHDGLVRTNRDLEVARDVNLETIGLLVRFMDRCCELMERSA